MAAIDSHRDQSDSEVKDKSADKGAEADAKDTQAQVDVVIRDSGLLKLQRLLIVRELFIKVANPAVIEVIDEVLERDGVVHGQEHHVGVGWPVTDQAQVGHDLHHVHQVPHGLQGDCQADREAELTEEGCVGRSLDSAASSDRDRVGCLTQELLRNDLGYDRVWRKALTGLSARKEFILDKFDNQSVRLVSDRDTQRVLELNATLIVILDLDIKATMSRPCTS